MRFHFIQNADMKLTKGEVSVGNKIQDLYKNLNLDYDVFLYIQPRIIGRFEPDFILVDKYRGISIIEVKDWSLDYIHSITHKEVMTSNNKKLSNPAFKTNQYFNALNSLFQSNPILFEDNGELSYKLFSRLVFVNIKNDETSEFKPLLNQYPTKTIFTDRRGSISNLTIEMLFSDENICLSDEQILSIRTAIDPIITITPNIEKDDEESVNEELMQNPYANKGLSIEQETWVKKRDIEGHFLLTGVPGSGKTVMLLSKAFYTLINRPDWKILIVTYNKSLASKLRGKVLYMSQILKTSYPKLDFKNIEVIHYHKLAKDIASISFPQYPDNEFWTETLPESMLENAIPTYDALFIDEYQDFHISWINSCIKLLHKNKDNKNKPYNILLAGDRLQSIYGLNEINWQRDISLDMRGRGKLLKVSYRTISKVLKVALEILQKDSSLKKEVMKFYRTKDEKNEKEVLENIKSYNPKNENITLLYNGYYGVISELKKLLNHYEPNDIMILGNNIKELNTFFYNFVLDELRNKIHIGKEIQSNKIAMTTFHSSKGLEAKVVFLLNIGKVNDRKLAYVALTRTSEKLYLSLFQGYSSEIKTDIISLVRPKNNISSIIEDEEENPF